MRIVKSVILGIIMSFKRHPATFHRSLRLFYDSTVQPVQQQQTQHTDSLT